jgi:hypothetical protein
VVPEYAFFRYHRHSRDLPGVADTRQRSFKYTSDLIKYLSDISKKNISREALKNRILLFHFEYVKPGETVVALYFQFGSRSIEEMHRQLTEIDRS